MLSVLNFNVYYIGDSVAALRVDTAWFIFGGIQDIFLAFMMFFVLNDEVTVVRDEKIKVAYAVLDVINTEAPHHSD